MHPRLTTAVLILVVVGSAAIPAVPPASRNVPITAPPAAGMRAYIDPATGALLPQPATGTWQRELQSPELIPDDSKLEVIKNPDGSIGVLLHEQRQAAVVAALEVDGSVRTECIESTAVQPRAPKIDPDAHHD